MKSYFVSTAVLVTGIILVSFSFYFKSSPKNQSQKFLGKVLVERGHVSILKQQQTESFSILKKSEVFLKDTLETGPDSEAMIALENQYQFRLFENSQVLFDQEKEGLIVYIQKGQINFENFGPEGKLWVADQGRRIPPTIYQSSSEPQLVDFGKNNPNNSLEMPTIKETELIESTQSNANEESSEKKNSETNLKTSLTGSRNKEGLSQAYITQVLTSHSPIFLKCFAGVLQKDIKANGSASMSFMIQNNGKTSKAEVTSTNIKDPDFFVCLKEALNRMEFHPFKGEAMQVVYPFLFK
jgi:hypothetical protein